MSRHQHEIKTARRHNGIFGVNDPVINKILGMGADAVFYNPITDNDLISAFARSKNKLYIVAILRQQNLIHNELNLDNKQLMSDMIELARPLRAIPLICIVNTHSSNINIKLYNIITTANLAGPKLKKA